MDAHFALEIVIAILLFLILAELQAMRRAWLNQTRDREYPH